MLSIVSSCSWAEAKKCLSDCKASPDVWRKVIERVLRKDDIRSLLMLVTSRFTKRCDLGSLDYIPLMRHARESISSMSDFEKSVMGILDRDGSHEYLGTGDMGPLHISMLISKHSGKRRSLFQNSLIFVISTTNLAVCVCPHNLTYFCPYAFISSPNVPKILFA